MTAITRLPETLAAARAGMLAELIAPASGGDLNPLEAVAATRRVADNALVTGSVGSAALPDGSSPTPTLQSALTARLSTTARMITALLAQSGGDAAPVQGTAPLWTDTRAPAVPQLAATLAQTVAVSGLFYESHLSDLALAVRSVADLRLEPQAQLSPGAPVPGAQAAASAVVVTAALSGSAAPVPHAAGDASPSTAPPATPQAVRLRAMYGPPHVPIDTHAAAAATAASATGATTAAATTSPDPIQPPAAPIVHPQAVALVNQQLDLLATQVFRWQGEAWPGVPMDWSVRPDDDAHRSPQAQDHDQPEDRRWSTQLSLALPAVGAVDVQLTLRGQGLHATVHVHQATSIAHCRAGVDALEHRLAAAGFEVRSLQVEAAVPRPIAGPVP